jgi:hypothetical protein
LSRHYAFYDIEALVQALECDGYALIEHVLTREMCDEARRRIDELEPQHWDECHDGAHLGSTDRRLDRYLCVFNRDPYWLGFVDRPGLIELAEAVLGPDCHIIGETAWRSHPGFRGEPLHVDYQPRVWDERSAVGTAHIPMFIVTAHFYLSEVGVQCAPTRVVPGSHRAGRPPRDGECAWEGRGAETILARAGDGLVFRSDVWHAGSDNTSPATRYLLQVHYGRREMAQHFSPFLQWRFNPEVLAAATKRQRRLLGEHEPGAYD